MRKSNFGLAMANMVMETISELQKKGEKSSMRHIKERISDKYNINMEKYGRYVPQYVSKGVALGIIGKFGDNFRTKTYVAKRHRRRGRVSKHSKDGKGKRRRRRRKRHH